MKKNDYDKIKKHLAEYKINNLNITESGEWWKNHKKYSHILPIECRYENIINCSFREELKNLLDPNTVHLGFHHLNSSQALALNLFGPLVIAKKLSIIDNKNISDNSQGYFEYIENPNENTNFDFFILNNENKNKFYFEVKYTESNFGKAKKDQEHKQKYLEIYKNELQGIVDISEKDFYNEYQMWRNIIYAKEGYVFFVLPNFRVDLIVEVQKAKAKIKDQNIRNKVSILAIDDIVFRGKEIDSLKEHFTEFEKKYLNFV